MSYQVQFILFFAIILVFYSYTKVNQDILEYKKNSHFNYRREPVPYTETYDSEFPFYKNVGTL
jgi:hypothetical protein